MVKLIISMLVCSKFENCLIFIEELIMKERHLRLFFFCFDRDLNILYPFIYINMLCVSLYVVAYLPQNGWNDLAELFFVSSISVARKF